MPKTIATTYAYLIKTSYRSICYLLIFQNKFIELKENMFKARRPEPNGRKICADRTDISRNALIHVSFICDKHPVLFSTRPRR